METYIRNSSIQVHLALTKELKINKNRERQADHKQFGRRMGKEARKHERKKRIKEPRHAQRSQTTVQEDKEAKPKTAQAQAQNTRRKVQSSRKSPDKRALNKGTLHSKTRKSATRGKQAPHSRMSKIRTKTKQTNDTKNIGG